MVCSVCPMRYDNLGNLGLYKKLGSQLAAFKQFSPPLTFCILGVKLNFVNTLHQSQTQRETNMSNLTT